MQKKLAWAPTAVTGGSRRRTYSDWVQSLYPPPYTIPCYGTENTSSRLGVRASGLQGLQLSPVNSPLAVPLNPSSALCLALASHNIPTSAHREALCERAPRAGSHLDIQVMHSFDNSWWLTFMATVLPIAVFILIQEEHGRTQKMGTRGHLGGWVG